MQIAKLSSFISYELTQAEHNAAYTYNEAQLAGIQNQLAAAAEDLLKAQLSEDDTSVEAIKKRAYTQGMLYAYKYLLSLHDAVLQASSNQEGNQQ